MYTPLPFLPFIFKISTKKARGTVKDRSFSKNRQKRQKVKKRVKNK